MAPRSGLGDLEDCPGKLTVQCDGYHYVLAWLGQCPDTRQTIILGVSVRNFVDVINI